jgi:hypothetical protein
MNTKTKLEICGGPLDGSTKAIPPGASEGELVYVLVGTEDGVEPKKTLSSIHRIEGSKLVYLGQEHGKAS